MATAAGFEHLLEGKETSRQAKGKKDVHIPGYLVRKKLGHGLQAKVYKAVSTNEDGEVIGTEDVAVKVFKPQHGKHMQDELRLLTAVQGHRNIIRLVDHIEKEPVRALVLELCCKDLYSLTKAQPLQERKAVDIMYGILSALQHLHDLGMVHRDIKPENISLNKDGHPRLIDFGLAAYITDDAAMSKFGGSFGYMAPEIVSKKPYGQKVDLFALGATFYYVLCQQIPFATESMSHESIAAKTKLCIVSFGPKFDHVSEASKNIIQMLMHRTDAWRPTAKVALTSPPFATDSVSQGPILLPCSGVDPSDDICEDPRDLHRVTGHSIFDSASEIGDFTVQDVRCSFEDSQASGAVNACKSNNARVSFEYPPTAGVLDGDSPDGSRSSLKPPEPPKSTADPARPQRHGFIRQQNAQGQSANAASSAQAPITRKYQPAPMVEGSADDIRQWRMALISMRKLKEKAKMSSEGGVMHSVPGGGKQQVRAFSNYKTEDTLNEVPYLGELAPDTVDALPVLEPED
eukprot:TRINITY_DN5074_c0_g1_i1.p1 TRINITY_DN5074_c0_g1~~TRINITY_DN5074_c0_g1_i1.p1  ORF type:complete len:517 (+),score=70.35 TRINITY_DN5074_c0_g1_i1:48-1598(+)